MDKNKENIAAVLKGLEGAKNIYKSYMTDEIKALMTPEQLRDLEKEENKIKDLVGIEKLAKEMEQYAKTV